MVVARPVGAAALVGSRGAVSNIDYVVVHPTLALAFGPPRAVQLPLLPPPPTHTHTHTHPSRRHVPRSGPGGVGRRLPPADAIGGQDLRATWPRAVPRRGQCSGRCLGLRRRGTHPCGWGHGRGAGRGYGCPKPHVPWPRDASERFLRGGGGGESVPDAPRRGGEDNWFARSGFVHSTFARAYVFA